MRIHPTFSPQAYPVTAVSVTVTPGPWTGSRSIQPMFSPQAYRDPSPSGSMLPAWAPALASRTEIAVNSDGFERPQTLDRYLSPTKLPRNPRWPRIYRTVEYVLAGCPRNTPQRKDLKAAYEVLVKNIGF